MLGLFVKRQALSVRNYCEPIMLYISPSSSISHNIVIESFEDDGIHTVIIYFRKSEGLSSFSKFLSFIYYLLANLKGYKFIKKEFGKPDIVHVNVLTRTGILALYLKLFKNIPYIISEHWSRYLPVNNTYKGLLRKILTKVIVKHSSAVITVTENLKAAMLRHGLKNKYYVIPNVVDTGFFIPSENKTKEKKYIIHISCFEDKSKNISGILNAIKKISENRKDFELHLVGDGIDFNKIKLLAEELDIKDKYAFFEGLKENEELLKILQKADFMVMFSNYENQPVVILESLSCGMPVIATAVGGIPEIINKNYGTLIEPGDENSLISAINYMLDNHNNFNKEELRNFAIKKFSNKIIGEKLNEIYLSLLK